MIWAEQWLSKVGWYQKPPEGVHGDCWTPTWGLRWSWSEDTFSIFSKNRESVFSCIFGGIGADNFYCSSSNLGGEFAGEDIAFCRQPQAATWQLPSICGLGQSLQKLNRAHLHAHTVIDTYVFISFSQHHSLWQFILFYIWENWGSKQLSKATWEASREAKRKPRAWCAI